MYWIAKEIKNEFKDAHGDRGANKATEQGRLQTLKEAHQPSRLERDPQDASTLTEELRVWGRRRRRMRRFFDGVKNGDQKAEQAVESGVV